MLSIDAVADRLICTAREVGDPISNLKLQKLAYYAQAWHLALHDTPLVDEPFQAWVHGPVCPKLYERFKGNSWRPLEGEINPPTLDDHHEQFLTEVWNAYGDFTAGALERMTHAEDPWLVARSGLAPDAPSTTEISRELMKTYYRKRLSGATAQSA